jgi:serine/threonine protein phosphatase PrpC
MATVDDARRRAGDWLAAAPSGRGAWVSHPGKRRAVNDDRAAVGGGWAAVADGVGSRPGSGAAAEAAVREFGRRAPRIATVVDAVDAVREIDERIRAMSRAGELAPDVATTLAGVVARPDGVVVVCVGDSPAWSLDAGGARLLTRPQRRWDPLLQSFTLLSAIGSGKLRDPAAVAVPAGAGIRVVLATDGVLDDEPGADVPAAVLAAGSGEVATAARRVLDHVLRGPADDNVTVAVFDLGRPGFDGAP